jgi:hypothetical protein
MEPRHGRFESRRERGVAIVDAQRSHQFWRKKRAMGNIYTVASCQQNVVDAAFRTVIESETYLLASRASSDDGTVGRYRYPFYARA